MGDAMTSEAVGGAEACAGTLALTVGYRGADFCGYAEQPGQRTVQGELRRALEVALRRPVEMECAGRTDAGVHAIGQCVSVPLVDDDLVREGRRLRSSLVALTPDDLSIGPLYRARAGFSARFDAQARSYRYRMSCGPARPVLGWDHTWWLRSELDDAVMHEAAQTLVGEHDFKSFCKASSAIDKPTHRCVQRISVGRTEELGQEQVVIDITGNAFLHSMVRTIAGTLAMVGRGQREPGWVADVLAACDRTAAGPCAPAKGLTFVGVDYPEGLLQSWE